MNDFVASFFKFQERKTTWQRETRSEELRPL